MISYHYGYSLEYIRTLSNPDTMILMENLGGRIKENLGFGSDETEEESKYIDEDYPNNPEPMFINENKKTTECNHGSLENFAKWSSGFSTIIDNR